MNSASGSPNDPIDNLAIGTIIEIDGTHVVAELKSDITDLSRVFHGESYPIGQFGSVVKIHFGRRIIFAFVGRLRMKAEYQAEHGVVSHVDSDERVIEADLFGEGEWHRSEVGGEVVWRLGFQRGVTTYPLPQQTVYLTPRSELQYVYGVGIDHALHIGEYVGAGGVKCLADMNELLGKHSAILGSTGSGKSGTVAAVVHSIIDRGSDMGIEAWSPRIVILDPHGEYPAAFPGHSKLSTDDGSLRLPYWLLSFSETISLIIGKTEFVATSQANIIKSALLWAREEGAKALGLDCSRITVDSPIPYKIASLISKIDASKPPQESKQDSHKSILEKLDMLLRDARLRFMMQDWGGGSRDELADIVKQIAGDSGQPRIVDLSGVPNEVAGVCSAVIARTLFNLKVWQTPVERAANPVLLVCEEAHRYVPNRGEAQYEAAQDAIRRIAKEGRKYGLGLLLVSQRPSEVEATVLSQCNSWIILRMSNEADRNHVRSILPDSMSGLTKMLSGLRRQEAIFVGQAAVLPSRIMIRTLSSDRLPRSQDIDFDTGWASPEEGSDAFEEVVNRWRYQSR